MDFRRAGLPSTCYLGLILTLTFKIVLAPCCHPPCVFLYGMRQEELAVWSGSLTKFSPDRRRPDLGALKFQTRTIWGLGKDPRQQVVGLTLHDWAVSLSRNLSHLDGADHTEFTLRLSVLFKFGHYTGPPFNPPTINAVHNSIQYPVSKQSNVKNESILLRTIGLLYILCYINSEKYTERPFDV